MTDKFSWQHRLLVTLQILLILCTGCQSSRSTKNNFSIQIMDPNLRLELVCQEPEIMTPIGLAIDQSDDLYVLESHTHSPLSDYSGPKFDRIMKGIDHDRDGLPEAWSYLRR